MGLIVRNDDEIAIIMVSCVADFVRIKQEKPRERTAVKHELKLDEFHIDDIRVQGFVREAHADMLQFNDVPLEGVLQSILEIDEIWNLGVLLRGERTNNEVRGLARLSTGRYYVTGKRTS